MAVCRYFADVRFVGINRSLWVGCARLGLVEFWMATGKWPDCAADVPYDFKLECARVQQVPKDDFGF